MILFRCSQMSDIEAIYELALHSGFGITTLPKDKDFLHARVSLSCASFNKEVQKPQNEYYLFVLEDLAAKKIVGTAAIEAFTGFETPFYSYKLSLRTRISHSLSIRSDYEVLSLVNDNQRRSELCTLFLEPSYRVDGNGLLLSKGRLLFMAQFPHRFASTLIAEMRGISDEEGNSPFWDNVGRYFFHMPFAEADRLTILTNKQFIADLMPRNPLYVKLLAPEAQEVIGQPHPSSRPALKILFNEGFRYNNYIDIFDAGPTIEAPCHDINTIAASQIFIIKSLSDEVTGPRFLLSNSKLDFKATISHAIFNNQTGKCIISKETAELLQVRKNEAIRLVPLQFERLAPFPKNPDNNQSNLSHCKKRDESLPERNQ
ncbi:arginine N-succinyltransferase [Legionella beliardensis]|uniref:Arginine N-succinyltransferase n=1 Tax=Legionella beliardensis TaxID=91822 RepID=A0A378I3C1_9GAMM|nr:arginine N-succinyltransferase [Legionella beliardensis]STX29260.1 arginine N-succinyltransferase [Legionella beliardensis]